MKMSKFTAAIVAILGLTVSVSFTVTAAPKAEFVSKIEKIIFGELSSYQVATAAPVLKRPPRESTREL